jgi:hypothetical protein
MKLKEKAKKRRKLYPIVVDGETHGFYRSLTIGELNNVEAAVAALAEDPNRNSKAAKIYISAAVCEEDGTPMFTGPEDLDFNEIEIDLLSAFFEQASSGNKSSGKA